MASIPLVFSSAYGQITVFFRCALFCTRDSVSLRRDWRFSSLIQQKLFGGPDRDRTDDLFHAMRVQKSKLLTDKKLRDDKTGPIGCL
jgi:hypothetical protein